MIKETGGLVEESKQEVTGYVVTNVGSFVSHYHGKTVFIDTWIGEWGKDLETGVYFNIRELEEC